MVNKIFTTDELNISANVESLEEGTKPIPYLPIGLGKPLIIRLHTIHVGDLKNGLRNKKQSVIVTSMIKDDITYNIPPRGVHQIYQSVKDRYTLFPQAGNEGTELIYYSPALDSNKLLLDIEIKANRIKSEIIDEIENGLISASGVPVFSPYGSFILAGGKMIKIAGNILNKFMDREPLLKYSFDIRNEIGGMTNSTSGIRIGTNFETREEFRNYKCIHDANNDGKLILAKNGIRYDGDVPYVILSVDGRNSEKYKDFKATIITAAKLKKYYGISDSTNISEEVELFKISNDYNYLKKIIELKSKMKNEENVEKIENINQFIETYTKNISSTHLLQLLK